jgi:hypothetical protein
MKNTKRFSFGLLSSLLLAAGFTNVAEQLDPINDNLRIPFANSTKEIGDLRPTTGCNDASFFTEQLS